mmetsp:Transcript_12661/g.27348  ORF Transcript_12661/g.27348 Transcript_12661/m.27348 type:complete len:83 (-) Transcript_12661:169-417(-)
MVQSSDALTVYGALNLANTDEAQFEADYKQAQLLIDACLFEVECSEEGTLVGLHTFCMCGTSMYVLSQLSNVQQTCGNTFEN